MRILGTLLLLNWLAWAHTIDYQIVSGRAVVVTIRLGDEEPASYSEFELFAPSESQPFQVGRSDGLGRVVFAPHRSGTWRLKIKADSSHGLHGASIDIQVNENQLVTDYSRPLVARHTRLLVAVGLLSGIFGAMALWKKPRPKAKEMN
jgi:nickel transport protein